MASEPRSRPASAIPNHEVGATEEAVLGAQQAAGNQAVASILGGRVQRAPNDEDPRISGLAHAPTLDPRPSPSPNVASSLAGAPTLPPAAPLGLSTTTINSAAPGTGGPSPVSVSSGTLGSSAPATGLPATGHAPAVPSSAAAPAPGPASGTLFPARAPWWEKDSRFQVGGEYGPKAVAPGEFGGVGKPVSIDPKPEPASDSLVGAVYRQDPSKVIRSPSETWHREAWHKSKGFDVHGEDMPVPRAFSDGRTYFVAPEHSGPATTMPAYAAVGDVGLGRSASPASPPAPVPPGGAGERPMARMPRDATEARQRQAVAPDIAPTGPWGSQVAQRVTYQEVAAAAAARPGSVIRSPNDRWHGQGYRTDGGKGGTPGAFKVGDQYVISPGYPLDNVSYLAIPGSGPGSPVASGAAAAPGRALPQAAQTVAPAGTAYAERSAMKSYATTTTERAGRTETRTTSREQAVLTTATEVSEGGITNRQEQQRGAGLGVGGNLIGATTASTDTSRIDGDVVAAKKTRQVTAGLGSDLALGAEAKQTREVVTGTDPDGNPVKQSRSTKATGKADLSGWQAGAGAERTNRKGTTTGAGGGLKGDWKGNVEIQAYFNVQTRGGVSFKPTVSHGVKVEASEPIEGPDGFEVVYRIVETSGAGVGGGKQFGSGASIGVDVGATEADFQGGRRTFRTRDEANAFRDNAAARVATEQRLAGIVPPTTVAGALQIPIGETRSSGDISGRSIGASAGYSGVAVNVGKSTSATHELSIKRTGQTILEVTGSVSGSKTGSVGISAPVLSHGYSSTGTSSFSVTYEFDVSKEQGRAAFERYCRTGIPPMQAPKLIEQGASGSDHETVAIPGLGSVVWTGTTWQVSRDTADGHSTKVYGGAQIHEQTPGTIGTFLGEDTLKSNAQIVRVMQDGEEVGAKAQMTLGGTSGEYNRAELGKIFVGAKTDKDAKPSGEWTLSADVPKENIRALERSSRQIRNALDEREEYSKLVKDRGARMLGGQVGITSKGWDLELKGDPNFPGEKERARLTQLRTDLMARVRSNPELAGDIVRETGEVLAHLARRREAVADLRRYTDLPDGLRQQQLGLIDMHTDDLKVVRRTAQAIAMKRNVGERAADVATRLEKGEKAGREKRQSRTAAEDDSQKADREYAKLQDLVSAKESRIAARRAEVRSYSKALGDAIGARGTTAVRLGADVPAVQIAIAGGKGYIGAATDADRKQAALEPRIEKLRDAWSATTDRSDQIAAIRELEKVLDERLKLMELCLYFIHEAGKSVFHITTRAAKSGNPAFWNSLGEVEGEE